MPATQEQLAQRLVKSGQLRIKTDTARNYVRLGGDHDTQTITRRAFTDPALRDATRARLRRFVAPIEGEAGIDALWQRLQQDFRRAGEIAEADELRLARALVQATDAAVITLVLREGAEIYVSYAHTVADLLPVRDWEGIGLSGGLQASGDEQLRVYVSCGGDPFFAGTHKTYVTDGFPALARLIVIAGQELGHYADLRREGGRIVGRYSTDANSSLLRADPAARAAWRADIARVEALRQAYERIGLARLEAAQRAEAFYRQRRRFPVAAFCAPWVLTLRAILWVRAWQRGINLRLRTIPPIPYASARQRFFSDMAFNLEPQADSYRHADPLIEEAIAVIEAVARVPQQIHKWGASAVACATPQLYRFYETQVLAGCRRAAYGAKQTHQDG